MAVGGVVVRRVDTWQQKNGRYLRICRFRYSIGMSRLSYNGILFKAKPWIVVL